MAEVVLAALLRGSRLADQVVVDSYGTGDWHVGELADPRTVAALAEHGLDATSHRARVVPPDLLSRSDLILCAEARHQRKVRRLGVARPGQVRLIREFDRHAMAAGSLDLEDPYLGTLEDYRRCRDDVAAACSGLLAELPALVSGLSPRPGTNLP
jgi:protein-tyrosine phosphatase